MIFEEFDKELEQLIEDTKYVSSISEMTKHPSYVKLVNMGEPILKYIFARMENGEGRIVYFPILRDITHVNPVPDEHRGMIGQMTKDWLQWGIRNGHHVIVWY
jgi:hypothetical protein